MNNELHMKTGLKKGQLLESGFEILEVRILDEFKAEGIWARHKKTGAEVFHILNSDSENLFSFSFATPSKDSSGAAHILEHSVLCGSENYPLKDAFLVLAQGSLQTFLNAITFPDKTVYPASSVNEHDYFNLMSVYGDAVFRPLLSEWTFMQEGHRLTYAPEIKITGVVYNEMKGAYSSPDTYAGLWSVKSVMPGTPYSFESGGDPDCIPDLSWEDLKAFHRLWYSPANCRIFLAGNIPTEKQLAFLDREFFSKLSAGQRNEPIQKTVRWDKPRSFRIPCPAGVEQKPTVMLSWLCGDAADTDETIALAALAEILLGHDGSPLTRALIDSGLGEDLSPVCGFEGELRETSFSIGLRGVFGPVEESAKKIEVLILGELERLVYEGIPPLETEAALLGMEFAQKEIRRSDGPFSLVWMRRSLRAWLHGGTPWDSLLFASAIAGLKSRLKEDNRLFEKIIRCFFLENPHRAFIIIEPKDGFLEEKEESLAKRLAALDSSMAFSTKEAYVKKEKELELVQEKEDDPKALAAIPHLSKDDLSLDIEIIEREYTCAGSVPMLVRNVFTNGISYVDLAFPLDVFPPADYLWFPFFARVVGSVGLPGMDYGEVSSLMARTFGGFYGMLQTSGMVDGAARAAALPTGIHDIRGRDWLIFRLKTLDEKLAPSIDLARRLIGEADFSDHKRLKDLVLEMKNELDSSLAPAGHIYASGCGSRFFSRSRFIDELWNGLDQIIFSHKLAALPVPEIAAKLKNIQDHLSHSGLLVNFTGSSPAEAEKEIKKYFGFFGPPRSANPAAAKIENFLALSEIIHKPDNSRRKAEIFSSASLQVGFASISLSAGRYGAPLQAAELVLAHQLSTGALWEDIRMKGGAYGAFAAPDHLEGSFAFSTYRDPDPLRSLEVFSSIIGNPPAFNKDALDKAVIGSYSRETRPRSPSDKSLADFLRFLYGIEDKHRSIRLRDLVNVDGEQINAVQNRLALEIKNFNTGEMRGFPVIINGKKDAEKAAAHFKAEIYELPV